MNLKNRPIWPRWPSQQRLRDVGHRIVYRLRLVSRRHYWHKKEVLGHSVQFLLRGVSFFRGMNVRGRLAHNQTHSKSSVTNEFKSQWNRLCTDGVNRSVKICNFFPNMFCAVIAVSREGGSAWPVKTSYTQKANFKLAQFDLSKERASSCLITSLANWSDLSPLLG